MKFGSVSVLREVSLSVDTGDSVCLLGPSGSGKSTLLAVLGGYVVPDLGRVTWSGEQLHELTPITSWVLQTTNILGRRSVLDNVVVGTLGRPRSDRIRIAEDAIARVGLRGREQERCNRLSGGERQRIAIARAIVSGAPFLLADEPTGQLDRATGEAVADYLFDLLGDTGIVLATHDLRLASRCSTVLELVDGAIVDG